MTKSYPWKNTLWLALLMTFCIANAQVKKYSLVDLVIAEKKISTEEDNSAKVMHCLEIAESYRTLDPRSNNNYNKAISLTNEAQILSNKLVFLKGKGAGYLSFSKIEQDLQHFDKTIFFAEKAIKVFKEIKEYNLEGEAIVMKWSGSTLSNEPVENRIILLKEAAVSFESAGNHVRKGDCLKELGDIYQINKNDRDALAALKEAIIQYKLGKEKKLFGVYDLLGAVYTSLGDYKEGVRYGLMAARNAEELGVDGNMLCTIYCRIGITYYRYNDLKNALLYYDKSLDIGIKNNYIDGIADIYKQKVMILTTLNLNTEAKRFLDNILKRFPILDKLNPIPNLYLYYDIYKNQGNKEKTEFYVNKLGAIAKNENTPDYEKLNIVARLLPYCIAKKKYSEAEYYNIIYAKLSRIIQPETPGIKFYEYKLDSIAGNYLMAFKNFQEFSKIKSKLSDEETHRQISQLNILYETEKKDKSIQDLKKTSSLQNANLEQARTMRNITFIVLTLLLIILIISIIAFFQKQKSNKLLQKKQEEINIKNDSLQHLVTEKEWLLREIHHRVKNNLHMVVGLLASQTEFIKSKEALEAISDSQHRVQAMSIIHQKLYQTETLSHINMSTYILELTEYLNSSFEAKCPIRFVLEIDSVEFPLSHSIPIGLMINEAITNAIKYAFPDCGDCIIGISLTIVTDQIFRLRIWDNGIGLPDNFDIDETNSLGMRLIQGLSSDIHGDLKIFNNNGNTIEVTFEMPINFSSAAS